MKLTAQVLKSRTALLRMSKLKALKVFLLKMIPKGYFS